MQSHSISTVPGKVNEDQVKVIRMLDNLAAENGLYLANVIFASSGDD